MAAATADGRLIKGQRSWAPLGLGVISILCFLYIAFLYVVASNPSVRALGFATVADIQQLSALFFVLLFFAALAVEHYAPEAAPRAATRPASASPGAPRHPPRAQGALVSLKDPHARPGSPPPMSIPHVFADQLEGGWERWKFPSERTGGIYIDTDVVADDIAPEAADEDGRGLFVLRLRDEVARVCVRCDLIDHCHGKVKTLITKADMMENHECVGGLRYIAAAKIERANAERAAKEAAAAAAPAAAGPAPEAEAGEAAPAQEAPPPGPVGPAEGAGDKPE